MFTVFSNPSFIYISITSLMKRGTEEYVPVSITVQCIKMFQYFFPYLGFCLFVFLYVGFVFGSVCGFFINLQSSAFLFFP